MTAVTPHLHPLFTHTGACGSKYGSTEPDDAEIEGQWNGPITTAVGSGSLALTLTETDGTVTGSGFVNIAVTLTRQ